MHPLTELSRRDFVARLSLISAALGGTAVGCRELRGAEPAPWPIVAFSKVYQELKLNFEETAEVTADAGLDGIDCPVRPGGQILPDRATDDLPRLAGLMGKRGRRIHLLTTGIQSTASPHAEDILRAAGKLGVKYYRLGYWNYTKDKTPEAQLIEIKAELRDLAALNKELGVCAILQNHAGPSIVGAKVSDLYEIARAFDPAQVAIAFDIGHAIHELDREWPTVFRNLRSHFRVAYVKDWKRGADFVPFGEGELGASGFFGLLRPLGYQAPISMHTEYAWAGKGEEPTKAALVKVLKRDLAVLNRWLTRADGRAPGSEKQE